MSGFGSGRAVWTQRDQVQAYQFFRRRIGSALQSGDANDPVPPNRRVWLGVAVGVGCAVLIAAGFGIYGVLRPGSNEDWRRPGQIVLEKDSGAIFVLGTDDLLHPVVNFASARLLTGATAPTVTVPARSLAAAPRGRPVGIHGAPTSLPTPKSLLGPAWTVCASAGSGESGAGPSSAPSPSSSSAGAGGGSGPGSDPATGSGSAPSITVTTLLLHGLASGDALGPDRTVIAVDDRTGARYAIAGGRRFRIRDAAAAVALGLDRVQPVRVAPAWLATLPAGPDFALIETAGSGGAGPRVGRLGTRIGQVLVVRTPNGDRHYVVTGRALSPVSAIEATLSLAAPATRAAYPDGAPRAIPVAAADVAGSVASSGAPANDFPAGVLAPLRVSLGQGALCVTGTGDRPAEVRVAVRNPLPGNARAVPTATDDRSGADLVFVPPGAGALAIAPPAGGNPATAPSLVSDQGTRFPLGDDGAIEALGYGGIEPVTLPAAVMALMPIGPALTRADAQRVTKG